MAKGALGLNAIDKNEVIKSSRVAVGLARGFCICILKINNELKLA